MHTLSVLRYFIVAFMAWTVSGSWHQKGFEIRRSLGFNRIPTAQQNHERRHGGEADGVENTPQLNFQPTGTEISPPAGTGCPDPISGVRRGNSAVPQGCPALFPVGTGVVTSGTGTAVAVGTGLPIRVANGTAASTGFPVPVGTGVAPTISPIGTAAPTAAPGSGKSRFELPYGV